MSARNETLALMQRLGSRDISLSFADVNALRRAQLTLHRWAELECGTDNGCIERDEYSGIPQWRYASDTGKYCGYPVPDREAGALKRIQAICQANSLHYYHQTDPRGCALYVSNAPLSDSHYTNGVACC